MNTIPNASVTYAQKSLWMPLVLAMSILWMAVHAGFSIVGGWPVYALMMLFPLLAFMYNPALGIGILLSVTVWQNIVISCFTPLIDNPTMFSALQGTNFVLLIGIAGLCCYDLLFGPVRPTSTGYQLVRVSVGVLMALGLYALYGLAKGNGNAAIIYFRNLSNPVLFLLIGMWASRHLERRDWFGMLGFICISAIIYGGIEYLMTRELYDWTNMASYMTLKFNGRLYFSNVDSVIAFITRTFFNTLWFEDLGLQSLRLSGPSIHTISFAYLLAFGALMLWLSQQRLMAALAVTLIVIIGAKGPLIVLAITGAATLGYTVLPRNMMALILPTLLAAYVTLGLFLGLTHGDYHVIGFIGGIKGFLRNPLGHGLGSGGNLGGGEIDWGAFQGNGSADFGLESAVGVLLYQAGVATLAYLWLFYKVIQTLRPALQKTGDALAMVPLAATVVMVNGIFQEEAYTLYGLGLLALVMGLLLRDQLWHQPNAASEAPSAPPARGR